MKHKLISAKLFPAPAGLSHTTLYGGSRKSHSDGDWAPEEPEVSEGSTHTPDRVPSVVGGIDTPLKWTLADISLFSMRRRWLTSMLDTGSSRMVSLEDSNGECVWSSSGWSPNFKK